MPTLIIAFLIIVFAALVSTLAASSRRAPARSEAGLAVLRVNRGYAIVAAAATALLATVLILAARRPGAELPVVPTTAAVAAGTLAVWVHLIMATFRLRVEFDRELVRRRGAWGKVTEMRWEDVREVRFNKSRLELALLSATGRITLKKSMVGFPAFLRMMKDRLDPVLARQAVLTIESLKGRL